MTVPANIRFDSVQRRERPRQNVCGRVMRTLVKVAGVTLLAFALLAAPLEARLQAPLPLRPQMPAIPPHLLQPVLPPPVARAAMPQLRPDMPISLCPMLTGAAPSRPVPSSANGRQIPTLSSAPPSVRSMPGAPLSRPPVRLSDTYIIPPSEEHPVQFPVPSDHPEPGVPTNKPPLPPRVEITMPFPVEEAQKKNLGAQVREQALMREVRPSPAVLSRGEYLGEPWLRAHILALRSFGVGEITIAKEIEWGYQHLLLLQSLEVIPKDLKEGDVRTEAEGIEKTRELIAAAGLGELVKADTKEGRELRRLAMRAEREFRGKVSQRLRAAGYAGRGGLRLEDSQGERVGQLLESLQEQMPPGGTYHVGALHPLAEGDLLQYVPGARAEFNAEARFEPVMAELAANFR